LPGWEKLADACLQALINFLAQSGYMHIRFDSYDYQSTPAYPKFGFQNRPREEFIIDLDDEPENLRKRFSRNMKANVRKGYKNELVFEKEDSYEATCCLDDCLNSTRSKKLRRGYDDFHCYYMKYLSKQAVEKLINTCATIYHVIKDEEVVSSSLTVTCGQRAYVVLAGTLPTGYKIGAFPFLVWNMMQELSRQGVESINLGGLPTDHSNEGLRRAKAGFGARNYACAGGTCEFVGNGIKKGLAYLYLSLANRSFSIRKQVAF
jgi:lipid II:glycine glycyltransferase (peptidoglycan interpeptide bridge formation enzyme)